MARRLARPVRDFLRVEAAGGVVLLAATVAALIVANTPAGDDVAAFWEEPMTLLRIGEVDLTETVRHWVDDGLMAIFFIDAIAVIALEEARPVAERMQHLLHPWSSFVILPLFAFANAGIELSADGIADAATSPSRSGRGRPRPRQAARHPGRLLARRSGGSRCHAYGCLVVAPPRAGALAGIGFTVSLFVTNLAFDDAALLQEARLGVLAASLIAAVAGALLLSCRRVNATEQPPPLPPEPADRA